MFYGNNVSSTLIKATIEALQPYPRGGILQTSLDLRLTIRSAHQRRDGSRQRSVRHKQDKYRGESIAPIGSRRRSSQVFSNVQYHGAVSWSWQQALLASGISRQLGLCGLSNSTQLEPAPTSEKPTWCTDDTLISALTQAQARLWTAIEGSAPALYTEVLSPLFAAENGNFTIGDLGAISPTGTEGDAIQLWSYGFLAQVDPRSGRPVAAGFA